jgi:5-methylcytosine-specific restriction endonuclease McrA
MKTTNKKLIAKWRSQVFDGKVRANMRGVKNTLTMEQWEELVEQSEGICGYCKTFVGIEAISMDHRKPFCKGGDNTAENVIPCCLKCNRLKWQLPEETFRKYCCC